MSYQPTSGNPFHNGRTEGRLEGIPSIHLSIATVLLEEIEAFKRPLVATTCTLQGLT